MTAGKPQRSVKSDGLKSERKEPDGTAAPKPKRKLAELERQRKRRWLVGGLILFALGGAFFAVWNWATSPASPASNRKTVAIAPGANTLAIGQTLQRNGIIRSGVAFALYARLHGESASLRPGRYSLSGDMTLDAVLAHLKRGGSQAANGIRIVIPEGYTLEQIAAKLSAAGVCDGAEFVNAATSGTKIRTLRADFSLPEVSLEGYLFPDTYQFPPHTPPTQVLEEMLMNFNTRFARPYQKEIEASGRDLNAIVTEASLIEREAKVPEDRARIAGVIENRLKRGMRLQIDASVLYALGQHKNRVLNKDLRVVSPYNTYRRKGLPPGAIACPGLPSLVAALRPEHHPYLYYVAQPDGAHLFSRTRREHEAAIRQVQQERRESRATQPPTETVPGG